MSTKDPYFWCRGLSGASRLSGVGRLMEGFLGSWVCLILSWFLGRSSKWLNLDLLGAGRTLNWKPPTNSQLSSLLASDYCVYLFYGLEGVVAVLILCYYFYSDMLLNCARGVILDCLTHWHRWVRSISGIDMGEIVMILFWNSYRSQR